jgi:hypothetical protein
VTLVHTGAFDTLATCTTAYTVLSDAASAPSTTCSGATALNYQFSYVPGTVTVNKKQVTITATSHTVTYGDAKPTVTFPLGTRHFFGRREGVGIG